MGRGWKPCGCGGGCDGGGKLSVDGEEDVGRDSVISFKKKMLSNAKRLKAEMLILST